MEKEGEGSRPPKSGLGDEKTFRLGVSPFPFGSPLQRRSPFRSTPAGRDRSPSKTGATTPSAATPGTPSQAGGAMTPALQTSFTGSPGQKLLMNTFSRSRPESRTETNGLDPYTPRLKGQDLYGGPVMFGSSSRRSRLLSSTPYSVGLSSRRDKAKSRLLGTSFGPQSANNTSKHQGSSVNDSTVLSGPRNTSSNRSKGGSTDVPVDSMSTTARLILDTLDKMSTPIQDAMRIPVPRAEKRKLVETELTSSLGRPAMRRPRLGAGPQQPGGRSPALAGPPLRKNYSPLPAKAVATGRPKPPGPGAGLDRDVSRLENPYVPSPPRSLRPASPPPPLSATSQTQPLSSTPLPPPTAAAGGKIRTKVGEQRRETKGGSVAVEQEEAPAPPAFLMANIPVLKMPGKLPDINFDLKSSSSTSSTNSIPSTMPASSSSASSTAAPPTFGLSKPFAPPAAASNSGGGSKAAAIATFSFNAPVSCRSSSESDKEGSEINDKPSQNKFATGKSSATMQEKASFTFAKPETVGRSPPTTPVVAAKKYSFAAPKVVSVGPPAKTAAVTVLPIETTILPDPEANTIISNHLNFKGASMPDVTRNFKNKGLDVIQDTEKVGLPDITASTGFGFAPAKSLKLGGSVMDILGKKN